MLTVLRFSRCGTVLICAPMSSAASSASSPASEPVSAPISASKAASDEVDHHSQSICAEWTSECGQHCVRITDQSIDNVNCTTAVVHPQAGGISCFVGTTRDEFQGKKVISLDYTAYTALAMKQMQRLSSELVSRFSARRTLLQHRIGRVPVGSVSVILCMSSAHRRECIEGIDWCIDELKRTVAIWKRECYEDGTQWKANPEWTTQAQLQPRTVSHDAAQRSQVLD